MENFNNALMAMSNPYVMSVYFFAVCICLSLIFSDKELTKHRGLPLNVMWFMLSIIPYVNFILALLFFALALSGFFMTKGVQGALDRTRIKKEIAE